MLEKDINLEQKYLNKVIKEIRNQKSHYAEQLNGLQVQKNKMSKDYADDFYYMDDEEAAGEGARMAEFDTLIKYTADRIERLNKQEYSPYFGRIDWREKENPKPYYIGVNNLVEDGKEPLVCDWRAPISSLFYDNELGNAEYIAPDGKHCGEITLKRQYEIKKSKLNKAFDSSLTIGDEILKDVLSKNASSKMQNIVSTIQKEQNKIIRYDENKNLLVQGVAGSGKTSIALHRVAYLLYQHKNTLKAEDVLIMSPNKMFSEYIAGVLPELGEENISQMSYYGLAQNELKFIGLDLEKREENIDEITKNNQLLNQVAYKHTYDFYESLQEFCKQFFDLIFKPKDMQFGEQKITAKELEDLYYITYKSKTPAVRIDWLVDYIIDRLNINENLTDVARKIKYMMYPFFQETNVIKIYADFLANIGMSFSLNDKEKIRYDDIAPLLYITDYFFGLTKHKDVKYLIIDEMQDYSFVAYSVFNSMFDCNKTVLGDIHQCIEKIMTKEDLSRLTQILDAKYIELNKSYRSTYEITQYASKIKDINLNCVSRKGLPVQVLEKEDLQTQVKKIIENSKKYESIAILVKDIKQAYEIYQELNEIDDVSLNVDYFTQINRICIMPSYMAKGLEFDVVIIPYADYYSSMLEKNLLYVSCTRALHELYLIK